MEFTQEEVEEHLRKRERDRALDEICDQLEAEEIRKKEEELEAQLAQLRKRKDAAREAQSQGTPLQNKNAQTLEAGADFASGLAPVPVKAEYDTNGFASFQGSGVPEYSSAPSINDVVLCTASKKVVEWTAIAMTDN